MKILIVTNYFPPEIGAASNRIYNLAKSFSEKKYDVEVLAPFPNYPTGKVFDGYKGFIKKEFFDGIKLLRFFVMPDNSKNPFMRVMSMLSFSLSMWLSIMYFYKKRKEYNHVIIQNSPLIVSFSSIILFKKILRMKLILNISDIWPGSAVDMGIMKKGFAYRLFKKIEKFNYRNSNLYLCQSNETKSYLKNFSNKPCLVYRNLQPIKVGNKNRKTKKEGELTLIYAGLLGYAQGVYELIRNMDSKGVDFNLHIYGDGGEKNKIINYLDKSPDRNIKYCGSLSRNELYKKLPNYHFSIVPLVNYIQGAFPSKIFEHVSLGVPIIFIGKGEPKEFVESNRIGYSIESNDYVKLNILIDDLVDMSSEDYNILLKNCVDTKLNKLNYYSQFEKLIDFISEK